MDALLLLHGGIKQTTTVLENLAVVIRNSSRELGVRASATGIAIKGNVMESTLNYSKIVGTCILCPDD